MFESTAKNWNQEKEGGALTPTTEKLAVPSQAAHGWKKVGHGA